MRAQADYLTANAYEVRTLVVGSLSRLSLGGGFALGIKAGEEQAIVPGVEALFGMRVTPRLEAETSVMLTFSPANLSQIHDLRGKLKFMYKTANSTSTVGYTLVKGFLPHTDDFVNSLYMRVDAFEENFPIGLTLGSGIDFLLTSNDRGLDVHVAGGLTFITKKHGIYFGRVKMGILSHREDNGLPYDISVGASFSL